MSYLLAVGTAYPPHRYDQEQLLEALLELWGPGLQNPARLRRFFANVAVGARHLALPKEEYARCRSFGERNSAWLRVALDLSARLLPTVVERAGLSLEQLRVLASTTVTGLAVPTLEARLMNRLPLSPRVSRYPLFGLGCLGGAAGIGRLHEVLQGGASSGALLAVELCSLTLQTRDLSVANLISTGLFGDGAAAVVMVGEGHPLAAGVRGQARCRVVDARSVFLPDTEGVMGWEFDEHGFKVVLSPNVPQLAGGPVAEALHEFLSDHGLTPEVVDRYIAHPGGPKVIEALEKAVGRPGALDLSRRSLEEVGNLSSVSVLWVLEKTLQSRPQPGEWGLLMAMGPAFCAEFVLLRWES